MISVKLCWFKMCVSLIVCIKCQFSYRWYCVLPVDPSRTLSYLWCRWCWTLGSHVSEARQSSCSVLVSLPKQVKERLPISCWRSSGTAAWTGGARPTISYSTTRIRYHIRGWQSDRETQCVKGSQTVWLSAVD